MDDLIKQLRITVDERTYPSESDEPFEVFTWPRAGGTAGYAVPDGGHLLQAKQGHGYGGISHG